MLAEAFLAPGLEAVYSQYAFAVYPICVQATGATGVVTAANPLDSAMPLGHDLDAMARAITPRTRIVFIANPNNPTGTWVPARELQAIHRRGARACAWWRSTRPTSNTPAGSTCRTVSSGWREFPNLVVLRTFSKAYGLAGVRVGYALSHPSVADMLNRVRQAFNVSVVGLAGAAAALDDPEHVTAAVQVAVAERARVAARLAQMGTTVLPSAGNFLLDSCRWPDAKARSDALLRARRHRASPRQLRVDRASARHARVRPSRTIVSSKAWEA